MGEKNTEQVIKIMKTLKAFGILILLLMLLVPKVIVWTLKVLEGAIRVVRTTLTFFIKQIESEVLKQKTLEPWQEEK